MSIRSRYWRSVLLTIVISTAVGLLIFISAVGELDRFVFGLVYGAFMGIYGILVGSSIYWLAARFASPIRWVTSTISVLVAGIILLLFVIHIYMAGSSPGDIDDDAEDIAILFLLFFVITFSVVAIIAAKFGSGFWNRNAELD